MDPIADKKLNRQK